MAERRALRGGYGLKDISRGWTFLILSALEEGQEKDYLAWKLKRLSNYWCFV